MESTSSNSTHPSASISVEFSENSPGDTSLPADQSVQHVTSDQHWDGPIEPSSTTTTSCAGYSVDRRTFDSLPDDVLFHILKYLRPSDLVNVSECSHKLSDICCDTRFWHQVHDVCNGFSTFHCRVTPFLNDSSTSLRLSKITELPRMEDLAEGMADLCLEGEFFESLNRLSNLKTFILDNHILDRYEALKLEYLPAGLTELRLKRIDFLEKVIYSETIFDDLYVILPNLEIVDVSHCSWVIPEVLEPLSKLPNLKELKMVGCSRMRDISDYVITSTYRGFINLETLNLKLTRVTFYEILKFKKLRNLKNISLGDTLERDSVTYSLPEVFNFHEAQAGNTNESLETLVLRNRMDVTDSELAVIERTFLSLKFLDVYGSSCSHQAIVALQSKRPEIQLLYNSVAPPAFLCPDHHRNCRRVLGQNCAGRFRDRFRRRN